MITMNSLQNYTPTKRTLADLQKEGAGIEEIELDFESLEKAYDGPHNMLPLRKFLEEKKLSTTKVFLDIKKSVAHPLVAVAGEVFRKSYLTFQDKDSKEKVSVILNILASELPNIKIRE